MAEALSFPSPATLLGASTPPPVPAPAAQPTKPKHVRRQSKESKKASLRKASTADASTAVRPKQSKSRNGCVTCKAKRLKCDEEKPGCQQCAKRKVECGGYKKDFKWRTFEETTVRQTYDRQRKAASPKASTSASASAFAPARDTSAPSLDLPSTRSDLPDLTPDMLTAIPGSRPHHGSPDESHAARETKSQSRLPRPPSARTSQRSSPVHRSPGITRQSSFSASPAVPATVAPASLSNYTRGISPTMTAQLYLTDAALLDGSHPDFVNFSMPEDARLPLWLAGPDDSSMVDNPLLLDDDLMDEDVESLVGPGLELTGLPFLDPAQLSPPFTTPPLPFDGAVGQLGPPMADPCSQPYFSPDSIEMITARFDRMTCGILSVTDGPNENPWRTLIWPLASQSPALYHAVVAMTCFHNSMDVPALRVKGHEHKQMSLQYIREGISEKSIGKQTAIATALALGFAESWDRHTDTGNTHIRGAQALVRSALADHKRQPLQGEDLDRLKFLCNAWVYMDVIARLTAITCDESTDFDNTFLFSRDSPRTVLGSDSPDVRGFGIDFGMPIDARLDPLMGCAGSLFPLIGRVANLVRRVCRTQSNSPAMVETAQKLQEQLQKWMPPRYIDRPEDPTTEVQHALKTGEAYRFATLLHLQQSVPELPSISTEDLARQVMNCLATVPMKSRTVIIQIFPLMVAGCVAAQPEDRDWVRKRWSDMASRMRIGVIEKSLQVTEEVWRRKDFYAAAPPGLYRICPSAELASYRSQQSPRPPRPPYPDFASNTPGAGSGGGGGVVYSLVAAADDEALVRQLSDANNNNSNSNNNHNSTTNRPHMSRSNDPIQGCMRDPMDVAYTTRGHAHWVGVMWDWGWEVLLG